MIQCKALGEGDGFIFISKIRIQNIKGKKQWERSFDGLSSNKVSLFVAPNGYGKSTLTTAFSCAAHGKMKLDRSDYFQGDESNDPCLEIEYRSDDNQTRTVVSDGTRGEISREFTVFCISNPVYAKATGRNMGEYSSHTADLYIHDVKICDIPEKFKLPYSLRIIKHRFGKGTLDLREFFSSLKGLDFVINYEQEINKCINQSQEQSVYVSVTGLCIY